MSAATTKALPEFIGDSIRPDYRTLPEHYRVGLFVLQKGRFTRVNDQACAILGYTDPEQLKGKSIRELIHPNDHKLFRLCQEPRRSSIAPEIHGFRVIKPDGGIVWISMQGHNTLIKGQPANMGYLIDIGSIRYLRRSLQKYRARITEVEDIIAEIDPRGRILFCTGAVSRIWKISCNEILGKNYYSLLKPTSARIARDAYQKVLETGRPGTNIIYEIDGNDGRRIVVEDSASPTRDRKGDIIGLRIVSRDITEQKTVEKKSVEQRTRLEAIFRSVQDAIVTVDPELKVIEANTAMETICGLDTRQIVGQSFPECLPRCGAACGEILRNCIATKKNMRDLRVECRLEQHARQIVTVSGSPLLDPEGDFMGAVLVIRDITRLGDLERELRQRHTYQNVIGKSKQMQDLYRLVEDLADLEITVLISGESGTGKNLIAKALHYSGRRAFKPFVTVNCSVLAEGLLESELFGHVKGAFTGAVQDKQGRFQAADGGTLLLDEIGDLSPFIQLKLLRVLQEKEFERVGESTPRKVDVRIIACTNKDLKKKVKNGEFREDLYYRLKVMEMVLPPLRDRLEDMPLLVEHFRDRFNQKFNRTVEGLHDEALGRFMDYAWPGNVRELEHAMERAFVICNEKRISTAHLPPEISDPQRQPRPDTPADHPETEENIQRILEALSRSFWNKSKAAGLLGMSRQTLYRKMNAYRMLDKDVK